MDTMKNRLMTVSDVMELTGMGRTTLYLYVKNGKFPSPIKITTRKIRWDREIVEKWLIDRLSDDCKKRNETMYYYRSKL